MSEEELTLEEVIREAEMEIPAFRRKKVHQHIKLTTKLGKHHGVTSGATGGTSSKLNPFEKELVNIEDYEKLEPPAEASSHKTNQN